MIRRRRLLSVISVGLLCGWGENWGSTCAAYGEEPAESARAVYLDDSFEATDALAKGRRLAQAGKWSEAAELLQRLAETQGDKLIRVSKDYYVGLRGHVNGVIAGWPEAGIAAYRVLYEQDLARALATASKSRSVDEFLGLFDRYFCAAGAADLADAIGQLAIESGDFALAERVYRRVLDTHPDSNLHADRYCGLLALTRVLRGASPADISGAEAALSIRWMGEDLPVGDVAARISTEFSGLLGRSRPDDWPMFGGDEGRNRPAPTSVDELGVLWRFAPSSGQPSGSEDVGRPQRKTRERPARYSVFPVVAEDVVYVQRGREIVALRRGTGNVIWRYHADADELGGLAGVDAFAGGWDSVTVDDGRVFASFRGDPADFYEYDGAIAPSLLTSLDAGTGELIWPKNRDAFVEQFSDVTFDSTPLVRRGRVYVVGRRRRSFGFEDCYLYRFNAADGTVVFKTHLGSASTGSFDSQHLTNAAVACGGDTIYVGTNLGAVAAVSAHSGAVRWLRTYERDLGEELRDLGFGGKRVYPWAVNPVFWAGGRLVCLPTDACAVMVLAADDGRTLHSIPVADLGDVATLLGVSGDLVCGVGLELVTCIDLAADAPRWSAHLPVGARVLGRGVWADEHLLVPTSDGLCSFRLTDGDREDLPWDSGGHPGNLLALSDQLLVAGTDTVSLYIRKAELWGGLRSRMAAAPTDPLPALELAEVALRGGETDEAVSMLKEAVQRAGGFVQPLETSLRRRFLDDLVMFVEVLSSRSTLNDDLLDELRTYASLCASDPSDQVTFRLRFGSFYEGQGRFDQAVQLYQQILRDRSLREYRVSGAVVGGDTAGAVAETRIARTIECAGPQPYAPFEAEAQRWLAAARRTGDGRRLERLVTTFPNSTVAAEALLAWADSLASSGRAEEAAAQLVRAYQRYPQRVDRPRLIRRIADTYEQAGRTDYAYLWLSKGAGDFPGVKLEDRGQRLSFAEYRDRLTGAVAGLEPSRPLLRLPLKQRFTRKYDNPMALLVPWFGDEPGADWSRYYVSTPEGVRAFAAGGDREIWNAPAAVRLGPELLFASKDVAVLATEYTVFGLDPATGQRLWTQGEYPARFGMPDTDWEDERGFRTHVIGAGRLLSLREDGAMICVALDTGAQLWSRSPDRVAVDGLRITRDWAICQSPRETGALVSTFDAATGEPGSRIPTAETGAIDDLVLTLDGRLIVVAAQSISSYDVDTASRRWHVTLDAALQATSLHVGLDAVYYSDDGRTVCKLSLEDGRRLWTSEEVGRGSDSGLAVWWQAGKLLVGTSSGVAALEDLTGMLLWRETLPRFPQVAGRAITQTNVVLVDLGHELPGTGAVAYFFDHRSSKGRLSAEEDTLNLGPLDDVRSVLIVDDTLLIQNGSTVCGWAP